MDYRCLGFLIGAVLVIAFVIGVTLKEHADYDG